MKRGSLDMSDVYSGHQVSLDKDIGDDNQDVEGRTTYTVNPLCALDSDTAAFPSSSSFSSSCTSNSDGVTPVHASLGNGNSGSSTEMVIIENSIDDLMTSITTPDVVPEPSHGEEGL